MSSGDSSKRVSNIDSECLSTSRSESVESFEIIEEAENSSVEDRSAGERERVRKEEDEMETIRRGVEDKREEENRELQEENNQNEVPSASLLFRSAMEKRKRQLETTTKRTAVHQPLPQEESHCPISIFKQLHATLFAFHVALNRLTPEQLLAFNTSNESIKFDLNEMKIIIQKSKIPGSGCQPTRSSNVYVICIDLMTHLTTLRDLLRRLGVMEMHEMGVALRLDLGAVRRMITDETRMAHRRTAELSVDRQTQNRVNVKIN